MLKAKHKVLTAAGASFSAEGSDAGLLPCCIARAVLYFPMHAQASPMALKQLTHTCINAGRRESICLAVCTHEQYVHYAVQAPNFRSWQPTTRAARWI